MIVLDTHAFFWWIIESTQLSRLARTAIERADSLMVPSMVLWEVLLLEDTGRIRVDRPPLRWLRDALARPRVRVAEIDAEIASQAIAYRRIAGGDPADKLIAATARVLDAPLVTRDERIAALPGVRTIW